MHKKLCSTLFILLLLASAVVRPSAAHAYSQATHQELVDLAWEVMLASQDPALLTGRGIFDWDDDLPTKPTESLRDVGMCDVDCGNSPGNFVTQVQWDTYLGEIKRSILAINRMPSGVSGPGFDYDCAPIRDRRLGQIGNVRPSARFAPRTPVHPGDDYGAERCDLYPRRSGIFARLGVGDDLGSVQNADNGLSGVFGKTSAQGLVLGWHAQAADNAHEDWVPEWSLVSMVASIPIAEVAGVPISLKGLGQVAVGVLVAPGACLFGLMYDQDCTEYVKEATGKMNPVTAIEGLVPDFLKPDLNSLGKDTIGFGHLMDLPAGFGGGANWYDDNRGYFIEEAGPDKQPGDFDLWVMGVGDWLGGGINPNASRGVAQYDLGFKHQIGHPDAGVDKRSKFDWSRDTIGHKQYTPLDNLAFYGWNRFKRDPTRNVSNLRWPLHALGDATVPQHVAGTAGYGHHPFEDATTQLWPAIRFVKTFTNGVIREAASGSPAEKELLTSQHLQSKTLLRKGFRTRAFIKNWQRRIGLTDIPVQDLVTMAAKETWEFVNQGTEYRDWLWCDHCSNIFWFGNFNTNVASNKLFAYTKGQLFEEGDRAAGTQPYLSHMTSIRKLTDMSAGYMVGFMASLADLDFAPTCDEPGESCDEGSCCVGQCRSGKCFLPAKPTCASGKDCLACQSNTECESNKCTNGYCEGGTECSSKRDCPNCTNGFCNASVCSSDRQCGTSRACEDLRCCSISGASCSGGGCCDGFFCRGGLCAPNIPNPE